MAIDTMPFLCRLYPHTLVALVDFLLYQYHGLLIAHASTSLWDPLNIYVIKTMDYFKL